MAHVAKRNPDRCPTHPGALLREDVIPATGKTKAEIAELLGISRQHLYDVLRERKPVSPAVAVRLGKLFGDGAAVWVRMQAASRYVARRTRGGCEWHSHAPSQSRLSVSTVAATPQGSDMIVVSLAVIGAPGVSAAALSHKIVQWRTTADEDGHYRFAVAL